MTRPSDTKTRLFKEICIACHEYMEDIDRHSQFLPPSCEDLRYDKK